MADKRNLDNAAIMGAAAELVEETSFESLTLNTLAARLGVKPPSLYNHVTGIDDVRRGLAELVAARMSTAIQTAAVGRSEDKALTEMAHAYRRFATGHPELYRAFLSARQLGADSSLSLVADTLRRVLAAYHLNATDEDNFIRIFHSGLYGFAALTNLGVFVSDVDASFDALVASLLAVLHMMKEATL